jgi:hypothetical protein
MTEKLANARQELNLIVIKVHMFKIHKYSIDMNLHSYKSESIGNKVYKTIKQKRFILFKHMKCAEIF